jgi:uncharacterized protein
VKAFQVNIVGLSAKVHHFDFELDDAFFESFGKDILTGGLFHATVDLDKKETFLDADIHIDGHARLICDRSLDPFDFPVHVNRKIVFKFGEEEGELSDEIVVIRRDTVFLDFGQFFYEFIALSIPIKRLHPRFKDDEEENDDTDGKMVYSSRSEDEPEKDEEIDPRWEKLKKLK